MLSSTSILTNEGYKPLYDVTSSDLIWNGSSMEPSHIKSVSSTSSSKINIRSLFKTHSLVATPFVVIPTHPKTLIPSGFEEVDPTNKVVPKNLMTCLIYQQVLNQTTSHHEEEIFLYHQGGAIYNGVYIVM